MNGYKIIRYGVLHSIFDMHPDEVVSLGCLLVMVMAKCGQVEKGLSSFFVKTLLDCLLLSQS